MKIRKTCVICNKSFSTPPKSMRTICSVECSSVKKKNSPTRSHHNPMYDKEYSQKPEVKKRRAEYEKSPKRHTYLGNRRLIKNTRERERKLRKKLEGN